MGNARFRGGMEDARRPEDAMARRCAVAADSYSQVMSGLSRGGRH
jgi:hypothetical protein